MRFFTLLIVSLSILHVSKAAAVAETSATTVSDENSSDETTTGTPEELQSTPIPAYLSEDKEFWMGVGKAGIESALNVQRNNGIAKNIILFVGDGMGLATVTASRIYKGQLQHKSGEEGFLDFEKFQNVGLLKTYNVDKQVPDSAGTASALFSGVKAKYKTVGFDASITLNTCNAEEQAKAKVTTIIEWAIAAKKSTGVVTTTRLTHATPAASYAHITHRDWECDKGIPVSERGKGCKDIARQLVEDEPGRSINVLLGGGSQQFRASINKTKSCWRTDGKDLVDDWMQVQKKNNKSFTFVSDKESLDMVEEDKSERLLGLFAPDHMTYNNDRKLGPEGEPSLEEMTRKAVKILQKNNNGFVLIVEGGRIDHAHHDNLAKIALEETVAFEQAISAVYNMTNPKDTLIVVTADHSHAFTINGYPKRGNPIGGIGDVNQEGFPYQTLSYMNGPGYIYHRLNETEQLDESKKKYKNFNTWRNLNESVAENADRNIRHFAAYWIKDETHGGEDVPVYASGPMGHLFHGVHEQTHVAFSIGYSACIGPYADNKECLKRNTIQPPTKKPQKGSASTNSLGSTMPLVAIMYQIVNYLSH